MEVNYLKKFLMLAIIIFTAILLASPLLAFIEASKKDIVPFAYTVTSSGLLGMGEVNVTWTPDWSVRIARGTWRLSTYNGPLGTGTLYSEAIISITHYDNETLGYTTYQGHGNYRMLYTITNGPYGAGTLEGISIQEWDYNFQRTPKNMIWGNGTFQHGTGDLDGIKMEYTFTLGTYKGEIILP